MLTIHQPLYIPWLGFFAKLERSDVWCVLDSVKLSRNDFVHRNKIWTNHKSTLLSIPLQNESVRLNRICDVHIANDLWIQKHIKAIQLAYGRAPFFRKYMDEIEHLYLQTPNKPLVEINLSFIEFGIRIMEIEVKLIRSRDLDIQSSKSELIFDICRKLSSNKYLSGSHGRDYLDLGKFERAGTKVIFQNFQERPYRQMGLDFVPRLSFIDALMNLGPSVRSLVLDV